MPSPEQLLLAISAPAVVVDAEGLVLAGNAAALEAGETVGEPIQGDGARLPLTRGRELVHLTERNPMMLAAEAASDVLWCWDVSRDAFYVSKRYREVLGLGEAPLTGTPNDWFGRVHSRQIDRIQRTVDRYIDVGEGVLDVEHQMRHGSGGWLWVSVRAALHRDARGRVRFLAGSLSDITAQKAHEQRLLHDALHDALTGLPNRSFFINQLEHQLQRSRRTPNHRFSVLFLDLDRFKIINDGHGHLVGDRLLQELAKRLASVAGPDHVVARIGGDEFTILLVGTQGRQQVVEVARKVIEELRAPVVLDGLELFTSASVGIAMSDPNYKRADDLLRDADTALYAAKAERGGIVVFDAKMRRDAVSAVRLETDLRKAAERNEFEVFYQPVIDLPTGRVTGFEALVRWRHPRRGLVPPDEFLPIAEETGMVVGIDRMVMLKACRQLREWRERFPDRELSLNVNVSARHFLRPDLVRETRAILGATRVRSSDLNIEITEGALLEDAELGREVIGRLNRLGTHVCIDDFGIGWSSLSYLTRLPVQSLKIDKQFTQTMLSSDEDHKVVQAIVALAHSLNLSLTAEGIDGQGELARMRELGVQRGQGYLFAAPLQAREAEALLVEDPLF
ncbi:MAG: EAL domain-containing protein [Deltaproteobacteria bacterium]|nr:MAG: EAL domain-containing protein [Deltaproteobacteria bacterium]